MAEKYCTCSKEVIDKTPGMIIQMVIDYKTGKFYDECRLCGKQVDMEIWKKANNIEEK